MRVTAFSAARDRMSGANGSATPSRAGLFPDHDAAADARGGDDSQRIRETPMSDTRTVPAVHGRRAVVPDAPFELGLAEHLRATHDPLALLALYGRFSGGGAEFDALMRRTLMRALTRAFGNGVHVSPGVTFRHPETFSIGHGVFLGEQAIVQGRVDGKCEIGNHTWIGPQAFLDARHLTIGEYVGWGPGAKVLGSAHVAEPIDVPIIQTDLEIRPVVVEDWADIGVNAVILPGVRVGRGAIVGAGAVVAHDVPPLAVAAGVPARVLRYRTDKE
jgi:acetyltransferase-like isoleucine patch superfamily enzyme